MNVIWGQIQPPVCFSVNKICWNTARPTHFYIVYGCFHTVVAKLNNYNKDYMVHQSKDIYYLSLFRKTYPTPALKYNWA